MHIPSLVPRPSLTAFFAAVEKSVGKAWKQTSRDACHRFHHNKGSRVHCTRDVFHVAHSGTLAALCSRDTRYSIVGEPDGSW